METLSSLKEKFKGAECVIETEKDYPDLKGFENCYFNYVLERDYYCLADERMFSFFRDYYEDIPNDRQKSKKQAFKLLLTIYPKKSRFKKNKQWWKGLDPPKTYALTSNGIFQQPLLVLLGVIIPQIF